MPDNIATVDVELSDQERQRMHFSLDKDAASIASRQSYGSSSPNYGMTASSLLDGGVSGVQDPADGFPANSSDWTLQHAFHVGFLAPNATQFVKSAENEFELGEMVVVEHPDGSHRFAKVLDNMGGGFLSDRSGVGAMYQLLVGTEPRPRGSTRMEGAVNIGKLPKDTGSPALDDRCRVEASSWIREAGNDAFNSCHMLLAMRLYSKALAYATLGDGAPEDVAELAEESRCRALLNRAMVLLRLKHFGEAAESCREVLSAQPGNTKAMYRLGVALRKVGNASEAREHLMAVFKERPDDQGVRKELSMCYGSFQDYFDDIAAALPRAADGHAEAESSLPPLLPLSQSPRASKGPRKAPEGWRSALELGHTPASHNANNTRAASLLMKLADEEKLPDAQFNLACYYAQGIGVPVDHDKAMTWYRKAAIQGHIKAQVNMALAIIQGVGCRRNETEGAGWMRKAADRGDARAQRTYGAMCAQGRGVQRDEREAARWYAKAARQNDTRAQFNLGACYQEGVGVVADAHKAAKWYWRAATLGDAQAMYNLGCCYSDGIGVQQDDSKAARWLSEAAARGFAPTINDPKYPEPPRIGDGGSMPDDEASSGGAGMAGEKVRDWAVGDEAGSEGMGVGRRGDEGQPKDEGVDGGAVQTAGEGGARQQGVPGTGGAAPSVKSVNISLEHAARTGKQSSAAQDVERMRDEGNGRECAVQGGAVGGGVPSSILEALNKRAASAKGPITLDAPEPSKQPHQGAGVNQRVVGLEEGMCLASVGLRVRLARGVRGNGVSGEKGEGSIQWVSKAGDVCHVRWDEASRFDYSYCCGHNGFHDLETVVAKKQIALEQPIDPDQPVSCEADSWSVGRVQDFVESLRSTFGVKCNVYKQAFQREDIDGRAMLALQEEDLKELGLSLGHRKVFSAELAKLSSTKKHGNEQNEEPIQGGKTEAFTGVIAERENPPEAQGRQGLEASQVDDDDDGESRSLRAAMRGAPSLSSSFGVTDIGNVSPTADIALDPREDLRGGDQQEEQGSSLFKRRMERLRG